MSDPDVSRNAAHERYRKAGQIAEETGADRNYVDQQLRWNADWSPGDPTYQEVQDNWDYYKRATNNGQTPTSQVARPHTVENVPQYQPTQEQLQQISQNPNANYYTALQIMNPPTASKAQAASSPLQAPAMPSLENALSSLFGTDFDAVRQDYLAREAEGANLVPMMTAQDTGSASRVQRAEMPQGNGLDLSSIRLPEISVPSVESLAEVQKDFAQRQAELPTLALPQFQLPDGKSFEAAQQDYFDRQAEAGAPGADLRIPSRADIDNMLQEFSQAKKSFDDDQASQAPTRVDLPEIKLPENFGQAREDFLAREAGQEPAKIDLPEIKLPDNFDQLQLDFLAREAEQEPAKVDVPEIKLPDNFDQLQLDFLAREAEQEPVKPDFQLPSKEAVDQAREDFLAREAEQEPVTPMINLPSWDSVMEARNDFDKREQEQKLDEMRRPGITQGEDLEKYEQIFRNHGGLQDGYVVGSDDILRGLGNMALYGSTLDRGEISAINPLRDMSTGLDKMANENFDDGTMRRDSVKAKYMDKPTYIEYVKAGLGGRSLEELEKLPDSAVFNKLDEARNYGFRPYIEDEAQFAGWMATQMGDDTTKAFNTLGDMRNLMTDPKIDYDGQQISRRELYEQLGDYGDKASRWIDPKAVLAPDDPRVNKESNIPVERHWVVHLDDGEDFVVSSNDQPILERTGNGDEIVAYWPGQEDNPIYFENDDDYMNNVPQWYFYRTGEGGRVDGYLPTENLTYRQSDGSEVNLTFDQFQDLVGQLSEGTANIDYGPLNIGKGADERKGFTDMFTTGDFSDLAPNMVDLTLGSAPLFFKQTAWPMAAGNAVTAAQGLDPRLYDVRNNTYSRLSDDMTGDKYAINTILSGLVPATEHVAGIIGGGGGLLGKPLQKFLADRNAPAALRYGVDVLGEGVEEDVASTWEDMQAMGPKYWFANQKLDENGNPMYDRTGHELRDETTPFVERFGNFVSQLPENFIAGALLGGAIGAPKIAGDYVTGNGFAGESRDRRMLRKLEDLNQVPHFKDVKPTDKKVEIGYDDIGSYGKR